MKLIHCADIHLDSKMESHLSREQARERRQELLASFTDMVEYGQMQGTSVILLAGDLFDTDWISRSTAMQVEQTIRSHPNIDFLYLRGNHDTERFLRGMEKTPSNLKLFGTEWTTYSYGNLEITGAEMSLEQQTKEQIRSLYDNLHLNPEKINIVMLHGQADKGTAVGENRIPLGLLTGKNIDYLALGHLHGYQKELLDARGSWCYSGCLEGRGFDECGPKGFVVLSVEESGVLSRFVMNSRRQFREIHADLTGCSTIEEIEQNINQVLLPVPSSDLVRLVLEGQVEADLDPQETYVQRKFGIGFYYLEVQKKTHPVIDYSRYCRENSLKGEFVRLVQKSDLSKQDKEKVIVCGIRALAGEDFL